MMQLLEHPKKISIKVKIIIMLLKIEILEFQVCFVHGDNQISYVAIFVWGKIKCIKK